MRARLRRSRAPDAELRDDQGPVTASDVGSGKDAKAPTSLKEAEDEIAQAELRAEAARARAIRLRRQAEAAAGDQPETSQDADAEDGDTATADEAELLPAATFGRRLRWLRSTVPAPLRAGAARLFARFHRPSRKAVSVGVAIILIAASLAASGYLVWQHRALVRERQHAAEFAAAARQGVVTIMSIDPDHAKEDFQRMIDITTGPLHSQLQVTAVYLVKDAQDAKVHSRVTVEDTAVESMTDNSAVVLVGVRSDITNPDKTKRPPALWRISVEVNRDGGQLKISKMDFVQ